MYNIIYYLIFLIYVYGINIMLVINKHRFICIYFDVLNGLVDTLYNQ